MRNKFTSCVFLRMELDDGPGCLLVLHKRFNFWVPVGGECEDNETPLQTAIREVKEETGIELVETDFPQLDPMPNSMPGFITFEQHYIGVKNDEDTHHMNFVFVADTDQRDIELCDEHLAFTWFPLSEWLPTHLESTPTVRWCWEVIAGRAPIESTEVRRLKELVRIHRRENWGLDGLIDGEIGEVFNHSDAQLYRSVLGD